MMTVERLDPGTYVELNDPISGARKLALVDDTGIGYFDLHADGELPQPLHSILQPTKLGSITSWFLDLDDSFADQLMIVRDRLTGKNLDVLTIGRALRWGIENYSADIDLLETMGKAATEQIINGRHVTSSAMAG